MRRLLAILAFAAVLAPSPAGAAPSFVTDLLTGQKTFDLEGNSMTPTLADGDRFVAEHRARLRRGDIAAFHPPGNPETFTVKRIIGLPGEEVTIKDGEVFIRKPGARVARKLREPYLDARSRGRTYRHPPMGGDPTEQTFVVLAKAYFLLGDNRQSSLDSRSYVDDDGEAEPFVSVSDIPWVALRVTAPAEHRKTFATVKYGF